MAGKQGLQPSPASRIEDDRKRHATFYNRRHGLFRQAEKLSEDFGAHIAVVVFSSAGRHFTFGKPSVDAVLSRFLPAPPSPSPSPSPGGADAADGGSNLKVATRKRRAPEPPAEQPQVARPRLWEVDVESIAEEDLPEFVSALERLKADVRARADALASSPPPPPQPQH